MENRNFKLDTEWNMIHYSEKPNGFGILIIGDERHFVDENKSFWVQNEGKHQLINQLRNEGYTIFYSNLYGKHWGSNKATWMAERLYHHMMRTEILNSRIHILAEGMGALTALKLMKSIDCIRSIVFINPIFSLKTHIEQEKEHKFFYKKLLREISSAYEIDLNSIEEKLGGIDNNNTLEPAIPIKILHILSGSRSLEQSKQAQKLVEVWMKKTGEIQSSYILPEKKQQLGKVISRFFQQNEAEL
jgi:hypothetical protein